LSIPRWLMLVGFAFILSSQPWQRSPWWHPQKQVLDYDLDLNSQVVSLVDDTWEVHGNVTLRICSTLTMTRATLILVGPSNGSCHLDVEERVQAPGVQQHDRGLARDRRRAPRRRMLPGEHHDRAHRDLGDSRGLSLEGGTSVSKMWEVVDCPMGRRYWSDRTDGRGLLVPPARLLRYPGRSRAISLNVRLTNCTFEGGETSRPDACG